MVKHVKWTLDQDSLDLSTYYTVNIIVQNETIMQFFENKFSPKFHATLFVIEEAVQQLWMMAI